MKLNWQQDNWPNFTFDRDQMDPFELQFRQMAGTSFGALKHLDKGDKDQLMVELISEEAFKTSEIEGEIFNRDSLQSSIRRHFGLATDNNTGTAASPRSRSSRISTKFSCSSASVRNSLSQDLMPSEVSS